jgi:hypothetical protein
VVAAVLHRQADPCASQTQQRASQHIRIPAVQAVCCSCIAKDCCCCELAAGAVCALDLCALEDLISDTLPDGVVQVAVVGVW